MALIVLLAACAPGRAAAFPPLFAHRLTERHELRVNRDWHLLAADCTGDGEDEILCASPRQTICYTLSHGSWISLWDKPNPGGVLAAGWNLTGDGRPDLTLSSEMASGESWLTAFQVPPRIEPRQIYRLGPFLEHCQRGWDDRKGIVAPVGCFDADGDGRPELYASIYPFAPGVEPRRLLALDGATGDSLWSFSLASPCGQVHLLLGRRGQNRRIIFPTFSPNNQFFCDGTGDTASYLYSLTPQGRLEWRVQTGRVHSGMQVALSDLDGDGEQEIVAGLMWGNAEAARQHSPTVAIFDPASGKTRGEVSLPAGSSQIVVADLDGDRRPEILVLGQDQHLYCLDSNLELRWKDADAVYSQVVGVARLDADRVPQIVCVRADGVCVLGADGRVLAKREYDEPPEVVLASFEGRRHIVARTGKVATMMVLERPMHPAIPTGVGLAIVLGGGALALRRRRAALGSRMARAAELQHLLLESMIAFGHAGASLKVVDRLRYWLINWERVTGEHSAEDTPLPKLAREFQESVLRDLLSLASLARRAGAPQVHWQTLPDQGLAVTRELAPLAEPAGALSGDRVRRSLAALNRIDACLKGIRVYLREVYRAGPVAIARRVLDDRQPDLLLIGGTGRLTVRCAAEPTVFVSPQILERVLDGLVDNALRAMERSATREVEIAVDAEGAHCRLDVSDTGAGIAEEDRERVFDRGYTTRTEGGGFGLHYAREVLARYEGRIFVLAGAPGKGVTFRVLLRISEHGLAGSAAATVESTHV